MANTRTVVFEIGTEELPAFALHDATLQVKKLLTEQPGKLFDFEAVSIYSTPRRIIVQIDGVPEFTEAFSEVFRGPSAKIAFDENGNPTKAAIGFAKGKGLDVTDLERREENGEEYVFAVREVEAKSIADMLPGLFSGLISQIKWPKVQRWGDHSEQFSRPVRWLCAMFGSDIIPVSYAGLESSNQTCGHRFLAPGPFALADASELLPTLRKAYIVPSEEEREASIREQVAVIEKNTGLVADLPDKTMREVVNLCEYPTVMVGEFDPLFLEVPKEITVDAMLVHQRYFPLFNADGSLTNKFLITSNGNPEFEANIVDGNQRVVAARLYDAKFFFDEDRKHPLEFYVEKLKNVVFQELLGTTYAKTQRVCALVDVLADALHLSDIQRTAAKRAAFLCKADLVTGAVVEFTSVQGIMGYYYALASGETEEVARAIADHYRPRFSGDQLPEGIVGKVVACADKIDTICGLFAAGQAPTASSDPFALRRQSLGVIAMMQDGLDFALRDAIDAGLKLYKDAGIEFDQAAVSEQLLEFFMTRAKVQLKDSGAKPDTIEAVLGVDIKEPLVFINRVRALDAARQTKPEVFTDLATAYARANNLCDITLGNDVSKLILNEAETALIHALETANHAVKDALENNDYEAALGALADLRGPIDTFFETTMVMDENMSYRENRLKLLNAFVSVFANVADFGKMAKEAK